MRIVAEHLSYIYNAKSPFATAALKDVSLTIEEGDFFGIIGHTGSGKSTFVQHLNGLIRLPSSLKHYKKPKAKRGIAPPPEPVLRVGEFDLASRKTNFNELRRHVGMVFQYPEYQLFSETVAEDVAFGYKNFAEKKPEKEEVERAVREAIEMVGLDYHELKDKSPFSLSGGQKRRVAIAGVLAMKPQVLILDEPTAGLDPKGRDEILKQIKKLQTETGMTILLVSHSMEDVAEYVDRIIVMNKGRIMYDDVPEEVFSHYKELEEVGLAAPQMTYVLQELKKRGFRVDVHAATVGEAAETIYRALVE